MTLVRWEPVRELDSLQGEMNRLFDTFFGNGNGAGNGKARRWIPAMDLVRPGAAAPGRGYRPTAAAALARKSEPSLMYLRATATLWWRVWRMMSRSSAPAWAAAVASPARSEWPA